MEMVAGMIQQFHANEDLDTADDHDVDEADGGRQRRQTKPAASPKPAPRGKRSRGRGA
jgi:hypothetical protein